MNRTALTFKKPYRTERNDWRIYRDGAYVGGLSRAQSAAGDWQWFAWIDAANGEQHRLDIPDNTGAAAAKRLVVAAWA